MLYFPKNNETKILKEFIKAGIIDIDKKNGDIYEGTIYQKGNKADDVRLYEYDYKYKNIHFDKYNLYADGKVVELKDLLLHSVIDKSKLTDHIKEIIESYDYNLKPVVMGYTDAIFDEYGESYTSEDNDISSYEIVTKEEYKEYLEDIKNNIEKEI